MLAGDYAGAGPIRDQLMPLHVAIFLSRAWRGEIRHVAAGPVQRPRAPAGGRPTDATTKAAIDAAMKHAGLI